MKIFNDISITGFSTSFESYCEKKNLSWVDHYVKELDKCSFKFDKNKYIGSKYESNKILLSNKLTSF